MNATKNKRHIRQFDSEPNTVWKIHLTALHSEEDKLEVIDETSPLGTNRRWGKLEQLSKCIFIVYPNDT